MVTPILHRRTLVVAFSLRRMHTDRRLHARWPARRGRSTANNVLVTVQTVVIAWRRLFGDGGDGISTYFNDGDGVEAGASSGTGLQQVRACCAGAVARHFARGGARQAVHEIGEEAWCECLEGCGAGGYILIVGIISPGKLDSDSHGNSLNFHL